MRQTIKAIFFFFIVFFLCSGIAVASDGDGGSWVSSLFGAVFSGAGGGIIGGVLGLGKKFMADRHEAKMVKEQRLERAEERLHDLALAEKEIERDMKAADAKLDQAKFEADTSALSTASASQDKEIAALTPALEGSWKWVRSLAAMIFSFATFTQKMIRPTLTLLLVWQTFDMFNELNTAIGGLQYLPVEDQTEIFKKIIYSILSLTGISVGFWYVARPEKSNRS